MWCHSHVEETAPEHPKFHSGSAQERPLETTWPAGKHQHKAQGHFDLTPSMLIRLIRSYFHTTCLHKKFTSLIIHY